MDDLLMGVFIAYMKSFASLHYRGSQSELKIEFDRPSFAKFIHELYKQSARKIWQMAYYFKTVGVSSEQQARNRQEVEKIVTDCMEQVIRSFLPWEAITKKYFAEDDEPSQSASLPVHHVSEEPVKKSVPTQVKFEDNAPEEDSESGSDQGSESGDDDRAELKVGDEVAEIEFEDMDKPAPASAPAPAPEDVEEDDPLKEIEGKAGETLVLNM
jgi:hypothetical protein